MKVLSFYTRSFSFSTSVQNVSNQELEIFYPGKEEIAGEGHFENCITAFIQIEKEDEQHEVKSREKKLVNHLKWVARKNDTRRVVLHSFAHLSASKAALPFTAQVFTAAKKRLQNGGLDTSITPFGFFLDLKMDAPGFSTARIWGDL